MGKKKVECPPAGAPLWMVTFSDMVTLLLTFFVLMLSMATMDKVKFQEASKSLQNAFGFHSTPKHSTFNVPIMPSPPKTQFSAIPLQDTRNLYSKIKTDLELTKINEQVALKRVDSNTIVLRISDSVLFDEGKATLNPQSYPVLRKIADIIRPLPMSMKVEGHTDSTPIPSKTMNNWDLSVHRGVAVMAFYNRGGLFPMDRISAVGYGAKRPVVPNISQENRAKNRRVDFILKRNQIGKPNGKKANKVPF